MDRGAWWVYSPWGRRESYTSELLTCMCAHTHTHRHTHTHTYIASTNEGKGKKKGCTQDKIIDQRNPISYYTISETELPFTVSGDQLEAEAELMLPK